MMVTSDALSAHIAALVAAAPPLNPAQRALLAVLLDD